MHATIPRYLRVYGSIKARVEAGDFKQGDYLPAEPELQKLFNVSRTTVRRAVELLAQEGFVSIQQGKGTEVLDYKATQRLQYVTSFSETLRDKGFTVRFRDLSVNSVAAPRRVAAELRVPPDTRLVRVQRVTLANGKPVADVLNYLLPAIVPGIERRIAGMKSLYAFLESEYNLRIEAATDWISATAADAPVASRLEVPEGSPLLVVRRITYSRGRPIEVAVLHVLADKYEYCVQSKDRPPRAE